MRQISRETRICGKSDQNANRDGCPSSEKLNGSIVGHFTGFHPQSVSVCRHLQPFEINDRFFWGHSTF
jgi:hypothetical protein